MLQREAWALGQRDQDGILHSDASELCVAVAKSHFAVCSRPQFLKLENACKTEMCIKSLDQFLACAWHPIDGHHLYHCEMGKHRRGGGGPPRTPAESPASESWKSAHQAQFLSALIILYH